MEPLEPITGHPEHSPGRTGTNEVDVFEEGTVKREKVCVPHRECKKRRAEGPSRPVASMAKGITDLARRGAGELTRE